MTTWSGELRKMRASCQSGEQAQYQLPVGDTLIDMNDLVGKQVVIGHLSAIRCVHCGRETKKSFNQGYCFPCVRALAQCDTCIIKPEKCHYDEGTCREPSWGEANCLQDHFVYLANTGAIKVGITRHVTDGVSSRWIDQGATQAMPIYRVQNRKLSGLVETTIAQHISDKTNWRNMLKGDYASLDLSDLWQQLKPKVLDDLTNIQNEFGLQAFSELQSTAVEIAYPVIKNPSKIKSLNLDKTPEIKGKLLGIKGQYLLFDDDRVFNIRNVAGYDVQLSVLD